MSLSPGSPCILELADKQQQQHTTITIDNSKPVIRFPAHLHHQQAHHPNLSIKRLMNQILHQPIKNWARFIGYLIVTIFFISLLHSPIGRASPVLPSSSSTNELNQVQFDLGFNLNTSHTISYHSSEAVDQYVDIDQRILNAAPVLGFYEQSNGKLSTWMANIPDQTLITSMSIPGTHDAATWNYTQETQELLEPITGKLPPAIAFQCQDRSLFQMLGDGIRFFDLRVGFLPDHQELGFYHASALLSTTATLPDALLGFYKWLDEHPSETILISIKVDNATFGNPPSKGQPSSKRLQIMLYDLLTKTEMARSHWLMEDSKLGTLGSARGKMILIQRINWDEIRSGDGGGYRPFGIPLPPQEFNDNDPNFIITYNQELNSRVYIEDFYNLIPNPTSVHHKLKIKFEAVRNHLDMASSVDNLDTVDQLFITFASGGALRNIPPVTPKLLAIGSGKGRSLRTSINGRIQSLITEQYSQKDIGQADEDVQSKRLGILIFDWYHQLPDLIQLVINQNSFVPPHPSSSSSTPSSPSSSSSSPSDEYDYDQSTS
ncbi:hypothetical protein MJO28_016045 [Puccinia striiformis f. sp. tritici]|uniref:Uncharacterized protein n=1 Tax=Puccinia striiformis f. sp. tritici TaxID=168172 RepID=A0ACC0DSE2_9BASI|nr:hypothetical protein MJO28_016045 [Puccinia striiformis f. sp. tritici]